jgi:hypothetical protein
MKDSELLITLGETEIPLFPPWLPLTFEAPPAPPLPIIIYKSFGKNIAGIKFLAKPPEPPAPPPVKVPLFGEPPPPPPPAPASSIITITHPSGFVQAPFSVKI